MKAKVTHNSKVCGFCSGAHVGGGSLPRAEAVPIVRPQSHGVRGRLPQLPQVFCASVPGQSCRGRAKLVPTDFLDACLVALPAQLEPFRTASFIPQINILSII